jgi:hypothetical protein
MKSPCEMPQIQAIEDTPRGDCRPKGNPSCAKITLHEMPGQVNQKCRREAVERRNSSTIICLCMKRVAN